MLVVSGSFTGQLDVCPVGLGINARHDTDLPFVGSPISKSSHLALCKVVIWRAAVLVRSIGRHVFPQSLQSNLKFVIPLSVMPFTASLISTGHLGCLYLRCRIWVREVDHCQTHLSCQGNLRIPERDVPSPSRHCNFHISA